MNPSARNSFSLEPAEPVDEHVHLRRDLRRLYSEHRSRGWSAPGREAGREEGGEERPMQSRWRPNKQQIRIMLDWYEKNGPPNAEEFDGIAAEVRAHGEVQDSKIYYWFQNRRSRDRRRRLLQQEAARAAGGGTDEALARRAAALRIRDQARASGSASAPWAAATPELEMFAGRASGHPPIGGAQQDIVLHEYGNAHHCLSSVGPSSSASKSISGSQSLAALGHENEETLIHGVTVFDSNSSGTTSRSNDFVMPTSYNPDVSLYGPFMPPPSHESSASTYGLRLQPKPESSAGSYGFMVQPTNETSWSSHPWA